MQGKSSAGLQNQPKNREKCVFLHDFGAHGGIYFQIRFGYRNDLCSGFFLFRSLLGRNQFTYEREKKRVPNRKGKHIASI